MNTRAGTSILKGFCGVSEVLRGQILPILQFYLDCDMWQTRDRDEVDEEYEILETYV